MDEGRCQSCGMAFGMIQDYGTEKDGTLNGDYCIYCYQDGEFTSDLTLEEMIKVCIPIVKAGEPDIEDDKAIEILNKVLPNLKRWQNI